MLATVNLLFSILLSLFSCGEGCKINFEKKDKHTSNLKLNKRNVFEFAIFFYLLLLFLVFFYLSLLLFLKPFSRSMDLVCCQAGQKRNDRVDVQMSEGHI